MSKKLLIKISSLMKNLFNGQIFVITNPIVFKAITPIKLKRNVLCILEIEIAKVLESFNTVLMLL